VKIKNTAIPLFFDDLNKKGNSSTKERKQVLQKLLQCIPKDKIEDFTADREFVGEEWFNFLENNLSFTIRVKKDDMHVIALRQNLKKGINRVCDNLWLVYRPAAGQYKEDMYLLTNHNPEEAVQRYKKRWKIEELFGFMKTRGFNLEDTHLTEVEKLETLGYLVSIACLCCLEEGLKITVRFIKKVNSPVKSILRRGLDYLSKLLFHSGNSVNINSS